MSTVPDVGGRDVGRVLPPRDETMPEGAWAFDGDVSAVFDDMLDRSIPQIETMRSLVSRIAVRHVAPGQHVLDLGCSRGGALAALLDEMGEAGQHRLRGSRFYGVEVSAPMRAAAAARFAEDDLVEILDHDLRVGLPRVGPCGAVLSVLTLQFTPIEHRLRIVDECRKALAPGGVLLLVEKVLGSSAAVDGELVDLYYRGKREAGYTQEQIDRKRLSLEGVLVPVTARWNEELLTGAGFREVECFWRALNFAGWMALA